MKKQALLLMAGGLLAFASCNTETTSTSTASDAQIDSMVNARVEEIRLDMMRQNDSMINALAQIKADSIIAAMKGGSASARPAAPRASAPAKGPKTDQPAPSTGATTTSKPGGIKGMSDQNKENSKDRLKGMSDQKKENAKDKLKGMSDQKKGN